MGYLNNVDSSSAFAVGKENDISGNYSIAMGYKNRSHSGAAIGLQNQVFGSYSFAEGVFNTCFGDENIAMGRGNNISAGAKYSAAIGGRNTIDINSEKISIALGHKAYIDNDIRFAIGVSDNNDDNQATSNDNNNAFVIDKDGNVGIGTDCPERN